MALSCFLLCQSISISSEVITVLLVAQFTKYLSSDYWYVWITASCLVTSLHANVSLLLLWQQFSFDMQMFWLEEFSYCSVALKLLLYRGRICGMSSSCGFQDAAEKCHQGKQWQGPQMSTNDPSQTQSAFLLNRGIRTGGRGFALTPLDWNPLVDIELHEQFLWLTPKGL